MLNENKERKLKQLFFYFPGVRFEGGAAASHAGAHAGSETVQVFPMLQGVRQLVVPKPTHPHPLGHQTLQMRDLPEEVHAAEPSAAAHPHAHRRQTLQVSYEA